ncbi:BNR-4 repeat-containing protein [Longispora sp. K20-0274]|uniref:BNR-4 repeat-containing protein n=1 Tax=Longispora sp. K20-0274 TaxID=3088255 RepID=UPI00399B14FD
MDRRDVLRAAGGVVAGGALGAALPGAPAGAVPAEAEPAGAGGLAVPAFTVMTPETRVAARTDRRPVAGAVHDPVARATFVSWGGVNEDSYVQAYDHATGTWSAKRKILDGGGDSHNYPTLVQAADGHLLLFVGVHNQQLVVARSPQPHAIAGTWTVANIAPAASYPMPLRTANGTLFVFYRETSQEVDPTAPTDTRPMLYVRSTDNGLTWRSSKELTGQPYAIGSTTRADHLNEEYVGQLRYDPARNRVHLVWTKAGGGPTQNVHDYFHKDLHHATFDPGSLRFRNAAGKDLGTQVSDADQDGSCRVATTGLVRPAGFKSPDYIQLTGWLDNGRPFLVWFTYDDTGLEHTMASVWTGSAWSTREVATGLRTRELERIGPDTWRVYATRLGQPDIHTFLLKAGKTWTAETTIAIPREVQRIDLVAGFRDPVRILATGNSSAREVSVADGDIYTAGL